MRNARAMTVIMSTASLEHVVYPLDKALAGAVLGMNVNVVFDGAAVRLLKRAAVVRTGRRCLHRDGRAGDEKADRMARASGAHLDPGGPGRPGTRSACPDGFEAHPSYLLWAAGRCCTV